MSARAVWKGVLKVGPSSVPVKLYAAVEDRKVRFHVLQDRTHSRVKQHLVRDTGEEVARKSFRKGFEVEPGAFVILKDDELNRLKPEESRDIQATRFVPHSALRNEWYERPYYLGPDEDVSKYFALVDAIQKTNKVGIVRWSMRGKAYIGALTTDDHYLLLIKLRYADEVEPARTLSAPEGTRLEPKELGMAKELVTALDGKFEPDVFHDNYRERVLTFVEAKAKGKHPRLPIVKNRATGGSLDVQLSRSLAAIKHNGEKKLA